MITSRRVLVVLAGLVLLAVAGVAFAASVGSDGEELAEVTPAANLPADPAKFVVDAIQASEAYSHVLADATVSVDASGIGHRMGQPIGAWAHVTLSEPFEGQVRWLFVRCRGTRQIALDQHWRNVTVINVQVEADGRITGFAPRASADAAGAIVDPPVAVPASNDRETVTDLTDGDELYRGDADRGQSAALRCPEGAHDD